MYDERVDHGLLPGIAQVRSQFEDTTAALYTTAMRCPIGIAHSVEDQACSPGITAILSARESVRRTLGRAPSEFGVSSQTTPQSAWPPNVVTP